MTEPVRSTTAWRAAFAGTLAMSMGIGPFAVNAVSALSPMVVPDLGLTRTELGTLATLTFAVAAGTTWIGGRQADRFPGRSMLFGVFAVGGAAAAVMASAPSLAWLWVGAVLGGVSQAVANPVTNQLIADHIPPGARGTQVGVKQSGVQMAQAVIGLTLPPLALVVGWRGAMLVGPLFAALGFLAVRGVVPRGHSPGAADGPAGKAPLGAIVWWLTVYIFTVGLTVQMVVVYTPLYSFEQVGLSAGVAGTAAGVLGAAGMAGRILWSRMAERWETPVGALAALALLAATAALLILAAEHLEGWMLWPGLVMFGISALAANGVVMLTVVRNAGTGRTGRASGMVGLGFYLGFMIGPVTFGALVDRTGSYTLGWTLVVGLCSVAAAIMGLWWRVSDGR